MSGHEQPQSSGRRLFRPDPAAEVDDELAFHLEMRTRELMARGLSGAAARERALTRFGSVDAAREECIVVAKRRRRNEARAEYLHDLWQDARYALRGLRRQPAFAAGVLLALTLGIGLSTAVFSVVDDVALRPLPYARPGELVQLREIDNDHPERVMGVAIATLLDWSSGVRTFSGLAATIADDAVLGNRVEPISLNAALATSGLIAVLGVRPLHGRWFTPEEDRRGGEHVVVLGHALWQQHFGGELGVIGTTITLDGELHTIVGVMPSGFAYPAEAALWRPLLPQFSEFMAIRGARILNAIGRVREGVPLESARADLERVAAAVARAVPENAGYGARLTTMTDAVVGTARPRLLMLFYSVLALLLIACANVAGLLLARGTTRMRELAVRAALGAGRVRLVRQLATESVVLGLLGGAGGILLAWLLVPVLVRLSPVELPRLDAVAVNARVLAFAVVLAIVAALVFGLIPAFRVITRVPRAGTAPARVAGATLGSSRAHTAIVVTELALSLVLLAGAGVLFRGFVQLSRTDPGFRPEQVVSFSVTVRPYRAKALGGWNGVWWEQLTRRLEQMPGVSSVSGSNNPPVSGTDMTSPLAFQGRSGISDEPAQVASVLPAYFETMGMRLSTGRGFTWRDTYNTPEVVVVNEAVVQRHFDGVSPIGKRIRTFFGPEAWPEIVGVVKSVRHEGPAKAAPLQVFVPALQQSGSTSSMTFVVRSSAAPDLLKQEIRAAVRDFDPEIPVERMTTMEELLAGTIALPKFLTAALGAFAALALGLALLGVYSIVSYTVAQRTSEFGVRVALGAAPADLRRLVLRRAAALATGAALAGALAALAATRVLQRLVFGTESMHPAVIGAAAGVLAAATLLASLMPAQRAARVNPAIGLRAE